MASTVEMPQMGFDMQEGTVVKWRKQVGDTVFRGDVIAEIETEKAVVELECYAVGVLRKVLVEEGRVVPIGTPIAVIAAADEELPPMEALQTGAPAPSTAPAAPALPTASPPPAPTTEVRATPIARRLAREHGINLALVSGTGPSGRVTEADVNAHRALPATSPASAASTEVRATPIARRLAREQGIDLALVTGTGPSGRVTEADVNAYRQAPSAPTPPTQPEAVPLSRMRQVIAARTVQSKRDAPHFYVTMEIDMGRAMDIRRDINDASPEGVRLSVNDLIIRACAMAIANFPNFNASFQDNALVHHPQVNIGIAIALEAGLIVASIPNTQSLNLPGIACASSDLINRAQSGALRAEEYTGATFAISNLGMYDVDSFAAIIFPPNAAVLAVGAVKEQPVVRDGRLEVGRIMKATISVDHRVVDGAEGARFLQEVKRLLEHPALLLL